MSRRFYLPQSWESPTLRLTGSEARHLSRVLRLGVGDEVMLFDGQGNQARARIENLDANDVSLSVLERMPPADSPSMSLTIATAVPKGDRFDWLVEKATELGVARVIPLTTTRSVVHPGGSKLERLRRRIVEASKQCGRSRLMELTEPMSWQACVAREFTGAAVLVADPSGEPVDRARPDRPAGVLVAIGPEGGFTSEELEAAQGHGARLVSLGPTLLRIETAAVAVAALWLIGGPANSLTGYR